MHARENRLDRLPHVVGAHDLVEPHIVVEVRLGRGVVVTVHEVQGVLLPLADGSVEVGPEVLADGVLNAAFQVVEE